MSGCPHPAPGRVETNEPAVHDEIGDMGEVARSDGAAHLLFRLAHERLLVRLAKLDLTAVKVPVVRYAAQHQHLPRRAAQPSARAMPAAHERERHDSRRRRRC
jgi:hypothetical protein